jgi:uncharacterized protein with HEPN domain
MEERGKDPELTLAARQALDEFVKQYENQIIDRAKQLADKSAASQISVSDIFESINEAKPFTVQRKRTFWNRVFELYRDLGFLITIAATVYSVLTRNGFGLIDESFGILFIVAGLTISLVGSLFKDYDFSNFLSKYKLSNSNREQTDVLLGKYIELWRHIELSMRDVVALKFGESNAQKTISQLMSELPKLEIITSDDVVQLRALLGLRNRIVHSTDHLETSELQDAITQARKLLKKLETVTSVD